MESDMASSILGSVATRGGKRWTTFRLNIRSKNWICNNVYSHLYTMNLLKPTHRSLVSFTRVHFQ